MSTASQAYRSSKGKFWTGTVLTAFVVLFLVFDGVTKIIKVAPVVQASQQLGLPLGVVPAIGMALLACTLIYIIPRTAVLGAVLLTGYLGGAVAVQVRVGNPAFETSFPIIFGVLIWAGIALRDDRVLPLLFSR